MAHPYESNQQHHRRQLKLCRVYRIRTIGYTVRYVQRGPKPHTLGSILYSTDLSQIGNMIIIIFINICVKGENVPHVSSIDPLLHIHWSINNTNTFLINYSFISCYNIIIHCRHSFTPQLTQNNRHIRDCSSKYICSSVCHRNCRICFLKLCCGMLPLAALRSLLHIYQLP